jgi:hypothetical protein
MEVEEFPAPTRGWIQSGNLATAPKDAAEVLDNFFPTAQGVRLRRGKTEYADIGAAVVRLMVYNDDASDLFASTASKIFDCARIAGGGSNAFGDLEGFTSGDWSAAQMSTSGGQFLVAVNGSDSPIYYDGTDWYPIAGASIDTLDFDAETAAFTIGQTLTGGTSGATATIQGIKKTSATSGTLYLSAVSGTFQDNETITDGATGSATEDGTLSADASTVTASGSGLTLSDLTQIWSFKERLFAVEKDTMSAWYLPVKSIGGTWTEIPLGPVFREGGTLAFGATWSLDSGDGLDDKCVFVSSKGEVAIYQGTDPSSGTTWALVGVYKIGQPLDKHASFRTGGDQAILTEDGIVSVAQALQNDRAALQATAITYPIEDAWQEAIARRSSAYPISATLWQRQTLLLVGVPTTDGGAPLAYVANARTGAWCRYTNWDVRCSAVASDNLYFGSNDGIVYAAETNGTDGGVAYTGVCIPKFSRKGPQNKFLSRARVIAKSEERPVFKVKGLTNYRVPNISSPGATPVNVNAPVWGSEAWGGFLWGGQSAQQETWETWKKVSGVGFSISVAILCTSNNTAPADVELIGMTVAFERGTAL